MDREIIQARKMLETLLKSGNHIRWIGGYMYGCTFGGKPFVLLYEARAPTVRAETDKSLDDCLKEHWRKQATDAENPDLFDTAIAQLEPWFENSTRAAKFRITLFGEWEPTRVGAYLVGMRVYGAQRRRLKQCVPIRQVHRVAKEKAMEAYWRKLSEVGY